NPEFTSFVGASAAPSHTPAPNPQTTPRACNDREGRDAGVICCLVLMNAFVNPNQEAENEAVTEPSSMKFDQKTNAKQQHEKRNDELQVRKDRFGGSDETHFAFPNGSG